MNDSTSQTDGKKVFTVAELTRRIRTCLEAQFGSVWVEGELSNVRRPSSGHYYFTVKDESAQLSGVLFRGNQRNLRFRLADGLNVRIYGEITVYEKGGNYQIIVRQIEEAGKGTLQARFEALKEKLREEGLFDADRKKPLPLLPQHVGLVTSPTGAAIRDILNVIARRFPNLHVVVAPVKVQGEEAAGEIERAIGLLNRVGGLDVMIVGRGGGSIEDLWCFNEECVARAIARSDIPVISAVGHEIDFTISDFVADLRAPTPSAAAELLVGRKEDFEARLAEIERSVSRSLTSSVRELRSRLVASARSYVFREPSNLVKQYFQRLDALEMKMGNEVLNAVRDRGVRLRDSQLRMRHGITVRAQVLSQELKRFDGQLTALNPLAVLSRGYSITSDERGHIVASAAKLVVGQRLSTMLGDGSFESEVTSTAVQPSKAKRGG